MAITIQCQNPDCQASYTVDDSIVNRNVKCRRCNSVFSAQPTILQSAGDTHPSSGTPGIPFPKLPAEFGRYRIVKLLGRGGMGCVYQALDTQLARAVALKIPTLGTQDDARRAARFVREAQASAILQHPNICTVYDAGQIGNQAFISMEFIEGEPLSSLLATKPRLSELKIGELCCKIAKALEHAHNKGIIHRDLKPANIMLTAEGEPKLMDFGLAKRISEGDIPDLQLTHEGAVLGTPGYMSPEQVRGDQSKIGPATDMFSLGVILYELLTGQRPYSGSLGVVLGQILAGPVPDPAEVVPDTNEQLAVICRKALAKEPQSRFKSMAEFAGALSDVGKSAEASAAPQVVAEAPKPATLDSSQFSGLRDAVEPKENEAHHASKFSTHGMPDTQLQSAVRRRTGRSARSPRMLTLPRLAIIGGGAFFLFLLGAIVIAIVHKDGNSVAKTDLPREFRPEPPTNDPLPSRAGGGSAPDSDIVHRRKIVWTPLLRSEADLIPGKTTNHDGVDKIVRFKDGLLELKGGMALYSPEFSGRNYVVRMRIERFEGWNVVCAVRTQYNTPNGYSAYYDPEITGNKISVVVIGKASPTKEWMEMASANLRTETPIPADFAVAAIGNEIRIYVNKKLTLTIADDEYSQGRIMFNISNYGHAFLRNLEVCALDDTDLTPEEVLAVDSDPN